MMVTDIDMFMADYGQSRDLRTTIPRMLDAMTARGTREWRFSLETPSHADC